MKCIIYIDVSILNVFYICIWTTVCNKEFIIYYRVHDYILKLSVSYHLVDNIVIVSRNSIQTFSTLYMYTTKTEPLSEAQLVDVMCLVCKRKYQLGIVMKCT